MLETSEFLERFGYKWRKLVPGFVLTRTKLKKKVESSI